MEWGGSAENRVPEDSNRPEEKKKLKYAEEQRGNHNTHLDMLELGRGEAPRPGKRR